MKRYHYMDLLNILATFAVVMLHSSNLAFSNIGGFRWDLTVAIQVAFIFAVPIFFMISGANILDYREREETSLFFKKRFSRVVVPFIFWSIVWFFYNNIQYWHHPWRSLNTYLRLFDSIMHGSAQPIFWYFYVIIGFYLSAPLLSKITTVQQKKTVEYLLLINLIFVALLGYYYGLKNQPDAAFSGGISIGVSGSIGFFVLGWYLKHFPLNDKIQKLLYVGGIISLIIMIAMTILLSHNRGQYQRQVYSIWGIFGLTWSAAIYTFFQKHFINWNPSEKVQNLLRRWASASLDVYVIHYFFIDTLEKRYHLAPNSLKHILIMPIFVWLASLLIVVIIRKIPYLRRTV
ncbi:polysaccharide biosynthesis protein (putative) [Fructobacillus pseudoficulneus]|uniref:Polysaccharide biosynthesis protein (Putative) n=1 Tax=Fructobacillus pseudoficulneus TaxID=220714 RepID=A0A3F3GRP4_9LACO|nr:acyltransferase [Fructobacillus pseudoficulneus]GAP02344.1 polysaccharide biosynthesis protein (putative) [Fructobacillus pseudoficulneus]SEH36425.1 Surface polysaccharide O-acyltransferase, integral membrane enzyme [Fructobacillus pseudoficulneus]